MTAKKNLWVDAAIFVAFLVAFEPDLTGIAIHEWLSIALTATILVHLTLHWDWVIQIGMRFFRKFFHISRLNFIVDAVLFVAFDLLMLSGILISESVLRVLGIQVAASPTWLTLHSWSADVCLIMTGLHFALHWKWIVDTINRYVVRPLGKAQFPRDLKPTPLSVQVNKDQT